MIYQQFEKYINAIKEQEEKELKVAIALDEILDGRFVPTFATGVVTCLVDCIETYFDCGDTLEWWLWERREDVEEDQFWQDQVPVPMRTVKNLYNYLTWNKEKEPYEKYTGETDYIILKLKEKN
jgi:hypothetical protein